MLRTILIDRLWVALIVVTSLYLLDYWLSIVGHRWFLRGAQEHYDYGGSYELNPPYVDDIENERPVSVRHLVAVARILVILAATWWFTAREGRLEGLYAGVLGFFILTQLPVQMRHAQNIALFRYVSTHGGVEGRARAERWLELKVSAIVFWFFAGTYVVLWALLDGPFFLGGAVGVGLAGARFWIFGGEAFDRLGDEMQGLGGETRE